MRAALRGGSVRRRLLAAAIAAGCALTVSLPLGGGAARADTAVVPGGYQPVPAANVLDTATGVGGPPGAIPAHGNRTVLIAGRGGIPATAIAAVAMTLAVVAPTSGPSFVTVYPSGASRPAAATMEFAGHGLTASTMADLPLGSDGKVTVYNGSRAPIRFVINVNGYFASGTPTDAGAFVPLPAANLANHYTTGRIGAHLTLDVQATGRGGVPSTGVGSVAVTLIMSSRAYGFGTIYPTGAARPPAANLSDLTVPMSTMAIVPVGTGGQISVYNGAGSGTAGVVVNVLGYYLAGVPSGGGTFVPVAGEDIFSTVPNTAGVGRPGGAPPILGAHQIGEVEIEGNPGVDGASISAAVVTIFAVRPAASGWFTAYPESTPVPHAASVDFWRATAPLPATHAAGGLTVTGTDSNIEVLNGSSGDTDVVVNLTGYYLS
jgi:hypothetical protein